MLIHLSQNFESFLKLNIINILKTSAHVGFDTELQQIIITTFMTTV